MRKIEAWPLPDGKGPPGEEIGAPVGVLVNLDTVVTAVEAVYQVEGQAVAGYVVRLLDGQACFVAGTEAEVLAYFRLGPSPGA